MQPSDRQVLEQIRQATGLRFGLRTWAGGEESIEQYVIHDALAMVRIRTYDVKSLTREDRFDKCGVRTLMIVKQGSRWHVDIESTLWDDDFEPFIYEKVGRRKTAQEFAEQREWELMCYRPGSKTFPLDNYDRVVAGHYTASEKQIEGYW